MLLHFQNHPIQFFACFKLGVISFFIVPYFVIVVPYVDVVAAVVECHTDAITFGQFLWRIVPLIIYFHRSKHYNLLLIPATKIIFLFSVSKALLIEHNVEPVVTKSSKQMMLFSGGIMFTVNSALIRCLVWQLQTSS